MSETLRVMIENSLAVETSLPAWGSGLKITSGSHGAMLLSQALTQVLEGRFVMIPKDDLFEVEEYSGRKGYYKVAGVAIHHESAANAYYGTRLQASIWQHILAVNATMAEVKSRKKCEKAIAELLPEAAKAGNLPEWGDLSVLERRAVEALLEARNE